IPFRESINFRELSDHSFLLSITRSAPISVAACRSISLVKLSRKDEIATIAAIPRTIEEMKRSNLDLSFRQSLTAILNNQRRFRPLSGSDLFFIFLYSTVYHWYSRLSFGCQKQLVCH